MSTSATNSARFQVQGLDCAEEITLLNAEVGPLVGGQQHLSFDLLNQQMTVNRNDGKPVDSAAIIAAITRIGMKAQEVSSPSFSAKPSNHDEHRRKITYLTIACGVLALMGLAFHLVQGGGLRSVFAEGLEATAPVPVMARILYALSIVVGVWSFLPKAWLALRRIRPDMNLLMVIAVLGAIAIGEWLEGATVAFLFMLSLALEAWSIARARNAVARLLDIAAPTVTLLSADGKEATVQPDQVSVGNLFLVRPGQRFPLDGVIKNGESEVDQSPLTGESVPVPKKVGDTVYAGTVNGSGTLKVECTKGSGDTALAHIIRLVGDAQTKRAPSEQWVETFARYYTPCVILLSVLLLLGGPFLFGGDFASWLYRALVLLVIACPCALVISTPVSIVAALAAAARHGILIKGGQFVEAPAHLQAVAMDKTGTITEGTPQVVRVVPFDSHTETELLERAAAMEAHSTHPLAKAIVTHARSLNVTFVPADQVQAIPGKGATGFYAGKQYWIGSHRYLEERKEETTAVHAKITEMSAEGQSVVIIGNDAHVCGFIVLADRVRSSTPSALQELKQLGIRHLVMLTGDNQTTAARIASALPLDGFRSELLPADKVTAMDELVKEYHQVAMVGDGINDAPSLARATIGIAMGGIGSDAAIETADVAFMTDDLSRLPWLIRHSRRSLAIIKQNIVFALAVKAIFVVLTLVGFASLWLAIAADTGASLLVIANGLRLLKAR